jgi:mannose-1-phosphate guanylyltransferase
VALCGVENLIVVETPDALLICHRDAAQNLKLLQGILPDSVK